MKKQHRHEFAEVAIADENEIARDSYTAQAAHGTHAECSDNEAGGEIADGIDSRHFFCDAS
jgi:hypothetical protein